MSERAIGSGLPGCQGSNEREIEGRKEEAMSWPASWGSYGGRTMNDRTNEGDRRSYKLKPDESQSETVSEGQYTVHSEEGGKAGSDELKRATSECEGGKPLLGRLFTPLLPLSQGVY